MRASRGGGGAHRGINNKETVHLGVETEQKESQMADLKAIGIYNSKAHANTEFFSQYAAHDIFEDIHKALCATDGVTEKVEDEGKYRMMFTINQKIPEIDFGSDEEEEQKESKEEVPMLGAQVQVKLLRVDTQKLAVEFTCKGGSK